MAINRNYWLREFDRLEKLTDDEVREELEDRIERRNETRSYTRSEPGTYYQWTPSPKGSEGWFERWLRKNRHRICGNAKLRDLVEADIMTRDLFIVFVDVLTAMNFVVPLGQVAMLLARGGLKGLCGKKPTERSPNGS